MYFLIKHGLLFLVHWRGKQLSKAKQKNVLTAQSVHKIL